MKSAFLPSLPDEAVDVCVEHTPQRTGSGRVGFSTWAWGRKISRGPRGRDGFHGPRGGRVDRGRGDVGRPGASTSMPSWARGALADLAPFASDGRYVNDVAEVGADVARTIYGDAKYDRLVALKREWDPDNVFRLNQNIQP